MNYRTIKWVLKKHIQNKIKSLWIWEDDNFTCIYQNYSESSRIYTAVQLLEILEDYKQ